MTVLDAYAVIALLKGEPAASEVQALIEAGGAALTSVGVAEVLDHLVRVVGASDEDASLDLAQLGLLDSDIVDERAGSAAGLMRARHYHRTQRAISVADCIAAVVAAQTDRPLVTSDPHLLDLAHDEGVAVIVLPDTNGRRWSPGRP